MGAHARLVFIILCLDFAKIMFYIFVYQSGTHVGSGHSSSRINSCPNTCWSFLLEIGSRGLGVPETWKTSLESSYVMNNLKFIYQRLVGTITLHNGPVENPGVQSHHPGWHWTSTPCLPCCCSGSSCLHPCTCCLNGWLVELLCQPGGKPD